MSCVSRPVLVVVFGLLLSLQTVSAQAPAAFNLRSPTNYSSDVDIYPVMSWDSADGAQSYVLRISRNPMFQAGSYVDVITDSNATWPVPDLLKGNVQYYWKVAAIAPSGTDTTWNTGGAWNLQTIPTSNPSLIQFSYPIVHNRTLVLQNGTYQVRGGMVPIGRYATLSIPAGAILAFSRDAGFQVNGTLMARGTSTSRIQFIYDETDVGGTSWGGVTASSGSVGSTWNEELEWVSGSSIAYVDVRQSGPWRFGSMASVLVEHFSMRGSTSLELPDNAILRHAEIVKNSGSGLWGGSHLESVRLDSNGGYGWLTRMVATTPSFVRNLRVEGNSSYGVRYLRPGFLDASQLEIIGNGGTGLDLQGSNGGHLRDVSVEHHTSHKGPNPLYLNINATGIGQAGCLDSNRYFGQSGKQVNWGIWEEHVGGACVYMTSPQEPLGHVLSIAGAASFTTYPLEGLPYRDYTFRFAVKGTGNLRIEWQDKDGNWNLIRQYPDTTWSTSYGIMVYPAAMNVSGKPERFRISTTSATLLRLNQFRFEGAAIDRASAGIRLTGSTVATPYTLERVRVDNTTAPSMILTNRIALTAQDLELSRADSNGLEIGSSGQVYIRNLQSSGHRMAGFLSGSGLDTLDIKHSEFFGNSGGGMRFTASVGNGSLVDSVLVENNSAATGAGIFYTSSFFQAVPMVFRNVRVLNNKASSHGGGIYLDTNTNVVLDDVYIAHNKSNANGGGLYARTLGLSMRGAVFYRDTAGTSGGGAWLNVAPDSTVFQENRAANGGGLYLNKAANRMAANTFYANEASGNGAAANLFGKVRKVEWNSFNGHTTGTSVLYGLTDTIRQNNLDRNSIATALYNAQSAPVQGILNWWGTRSDQIAVEGMIWHQPDQSTRGLVTFQPFLGNPSDSVPGAVRTISEIGFKYDNTYALPAGEFVPPGDTLWLEVHGEDTNPYSADPLVVVLFNTTTWTTVSPVLEETGPATGIFRGFAILGASTDLNINRIEAALGDTIAMYWSKDVEFANGVKITVGYRDANEAPVFTQTPGDQEVTEGDIVTISWSASDADVGPLPLSYQIVLRGPGLPEAGEVFDRGAQATWEWTTVVAGSYTAEIRATDGLDTITHTVNILVNPDQNVVIDRGDGYLEIRSTKALLAQWVRVYDGRGRLLHHGALHPTETTLYHGQTKPGVLLVQVGRKVYLVPVLK